MIRKSDAEKNGVATKDGGSRLQAGNEAMREKLRELLPPLVNSDGQLDLKSLKEIMDVANGGSNDQGYELTFAGKGYARAQASAPTAHELKAEKAQSKHFDTTKNVVIRGDNLDVLKILYQNYFGKIKMIYIDPPYNTQSENFIYKDNFKVSDEQLIEKFDMKPDTVDFLQNVYGTRSHSGWLSFMYPRLKLARELLSDDGVIFISIDDNEQANLKIMCDEIFGEDNFVGEFIIASNPRGSQASRLIATEHELLLSYGKKITDVGINGYSKSEDASEYSLIDERGKYRLLGLRQRGGAWRREHRPNMHYPIYINPDNGEVSLTKDEVFTKMSLPKRPSGEDSRWTWGKEKFEKNTHLLVGKNISRNGESDCWDIFRKDYLFSDDGKIAIQKVKSIWSEKELNYQNGKNNIKSLFGNSEIFDFPKPFFLMEKCIKMLDTEDDFILDFFAGSGTTGDAVMRLNAEDGGSRKFILVQWDEEISKDNATAHKFCTDNGLEPVISSITLERLNRAGEKVKSEIAAHNNTASDEDKKAMPDIGYKVYSTTLKPVMVNEAEGEATNLQLSNQRATTLDTLTNMLCATGKTLDTRIECLIENVLYEADNEIYLLGAMDAAQLTPHKDKKINLDGWSDVDLYDLLNAGLYDSKNITVIY